MRCAAVCQQLTESTKYEELSSVLLLCMAVLQLHTHLSIRILDLYPVFQELFLPVAETVWVVSFGSGLRLMMEESGEVSVKRDRDWVSANAVNR